MPAPASSATVPAGLRAAFVDEARLGVFLEEDGLVAFTWELTGVHRGPFAGVAPTGKQVTLAGINVERLVSAGSWSTGVSSISPA